MGFWETLAGLGGIAGGGLLAATGVGAPLAGAAIGAGTGLLKSSLVDQPREDQDKVVAGETQRYQPFTGIATPGIRRANPVGDTIGGGFTGAALGQGLAGLAGTPEVTGAASASEGANLGVLPAASTAPDNFWGLQGGLSADPMALGSGSAGLVPGALKYGSAAAGPSLGASLGQAGNMFGLQGGLNADLGGMPSYGGLHGAGNGGYWANLVKNRKLAQE